MLWHQPLNGKAQQLDLGNIMPRSFSLSKGGAVALVGYTKDRPSELYVMDSLHGKPRLLTHLNDFLDKLTLGKSQAVDWTSDDGFKADGILTYPADYVQGKKYPLVLVIHGGPEIGRASCRERV